jgi:hypothetical protein
VWSSTQDGVRFQKEGGRDRGTAWVGISGRVDLTWCIAEQSGEEGPTFPLVELLHPVSQMLTAVTGERYRRMFGRSFRRHRRGFDWFIAVSPTVNVPPVGQVRWRSIEFPGQVPPSSGATRIFLPPWGLHSEGAEKLESAPRSRKRGASIPHRHAEGERVLRSGCSGE